MDLSLIIPAYNEENRIGATVQAYVEYLRKTDLQFELIVEMDGCTDRTAEIVKELAATYPEIRVVEFHKKLGKGGGIEKAMPYATGKVVGFVDADCSVQPEEFQKLLPPVVDGYDAAISSRRAKGAIIEQGMPIQRQVASLTFNYLVRMLFDLPYKDTQCGAKVFKRQVIADILPDMATDGFAFDVDLLYVAHSKGYKVDEVGIKWSHDEDSRVSVVTAAPEMLAALLRLKVRHAERPQTR